MNFSPFFEILNFLKARSRLKKAVKAKKERRGYS
jgi:hypothetical protein